jgi:class 3 adenylate cyclase
VSCGAVQPRRAHACGVEPRRGRCVRVDRALGARGYDLGIAIRAGVHVGEVEAVAGDILGVRVNVAARVAALAEASQVLVSSTVKDLVAGSGLLFDDAGTYELKGLQETWRLYAVTAK